ncbi:MAG TPA: S8 family serine peptidase [Candidatus Thermoplasmatota archaeon]|nr:S8 family serine peptidase [Candidatus Thermoplasmatota archaeon]
MRALSITVLVLSALLVLPAFATPADAALEPRRHHPSIGVPDSEVVVAVIDTGADGLHVEFGGYRGQAGVASPQIVAWWDFGTSGVPPIGATWDPNRAIPYDGCRSSCHGTATAGAVGGKTVGAYPGVKLAIAKVTDADGSITSVDQAIEWAVNTVGADILSISIGTIIPITGALDTTDEVMEMVAARGVLPVVAAGNGLGNAGVKFPAEGSSPAYAPNALIVGASGASGTASARTTGAYFSNTDPEVIAWGANVVVARPGNVYSTASGTSFAAPLVAGWSARLMQAAKDHAADASPERVRALVHRAALDDAAVPFAIEGFGFVNAAAVNAVLPHARAGTLPAAPSIANVLAHEASLEARRASTAHDAVTIALPTGASNPGFLPPSGPMGARAIHPYGILLREGERVEVRVDWFDPAGRDVDAIFADVNVGTTDIDIGVYRPGAGARGLWSHGDVRLASAHGSRVGANHEAVGFLALETGVYTLLVEGYLVGASGQAYTVTVKVDGAPVEPTYLGDLVTPAGRMA